MLAAVVGLAAGAAIGVVVNLRGTMTQEEAMAEGRAVPNRAAEAESGRLTYDVFAGLGGEPVSTIELRKDGYWHTIDDSGLGPWLLPADAVAELVGPEDEDG